MAAGLGARCLRAKIEVLRKDLLEAIEANSGDLTSEEVLAHSRRLDEAIVLFQLMTPALAEICRVCADLGRCGAMEHQGELKASEVSEGLGSCREQARMLSYQVR
ncbi:MAG: Spo0E family sporulation regulatory protein-aspartic acid phosphatase [Clostridia bacterium]